MGIYCDRIIGYRMEVTEEYLKANDLLSQKHNDDEGYLLWETYVGDEHADIYNHLLDAQGFVPYYRRQKPTTDNIMLLVDMLGGEYAWLVYINEVDYRSYNEEDENETINKALELTPVPEHVQEKMRECYKILFDKEECNNEIKFQQISHWH